MDSKGMPYQARKMVFRAMADPRARRILEVMAETRPYTFKASCNTAYLAGQLAEAHGYQGDVQELVLAALLHDAGMLAVPEALTAKRGRLTPEERAIVLEHVPIGTEMLSAAGFGGTVVEVALRHHERSDGSGYPDGLPSSRIPIEAKLVLVCDVYEALTSDKPWRKGYNMYEAASMMQGMPLSAAILQSIKRCGDT